MFTSFPLALSRLNRGDRRSSPDEFCPSSQMRRDCMDVKPFIITRLDNGMNRGKGRCAADPENHSFGKHVRGMCSDPLPVSQRPHARGDFRTSQHRRKTGTCQRSCNGVGHLTSSNSLEVPSRKLQYPHIISVAAIRIATAPH